MLPRIMAVLFIILLTGCGSYSSYSNEAPDPTEMASYDQYLEDQWSANQRLAQMDETE